MKISNKPRLWEKGVDLLVRLAYAVWKLFHKEEKIPYYCMSNEELKAL